MAHVVRHADRLEKRRRNSHTTRQTQRISLCWPDVEPIPRAVGQGSSMLETAVAGRWLATRVFRKQDRASSLPLTVCNSTDRIRQLSFAPRVGFAPQHARWKRARPGAEAQVLRTDHVRPDLAIYTARQYSKLNPSPKRPLKARKRKYLAIQFLLS